MKAPLFELQADEEAKTAFKLLLGDTRHVKLKRRKALNCVSTLFTVGDDFSRRCFEDGNDTYKGAYNKRAYAKDVAFYFVLFPAAFIIFTVIFAAIIFLGALQKAMVETPSVLILLLICWIASGAAAVVLPALRVYKGKFLKSAFYHLDDVYVVYDNSGAPCIICDEQYRVKVLYGEKLYFADDRGNGLITDDPQKIYMEYLNLFPQSVLDMGAFVKERKKRFLANDAGHRKDVTAVFCEFGNGASLSVNATDINVTIWKLHKVLFDFDKDLNLTAIYSIAGKGYGEYITLAEVVSREGEALSDLTDVEEKFPALSGLLKEIL